MSVRPSCWTKSSKSFTLRVASGRSYTRQHAAIQVSLAGLGRPRSIAGGGDLTPRYCDVFRAGQDGHVGKPVCEFIAARGSPFAQVSPLGQLGESDERDQRVTTGKAREHRHGQLALETERSNVGIENDRVHSPGTLRQFSAASGVGVVQELL